MSLKKILIIAGIVVVLALIVVLNMGQKGSSDQVEVAVVSRGHIVSKVNADGILKAKAQVDVSAETIGRIRKIHFREGAIVAKGSLLIELDDQQARATRDLARAQRAQAEQTLERSRKLFEQGLISPESFEQVEVSCQGARANYEQAQDAFEKTRIYAPIAGRVMKINVEEGETAVMGTMNYAGTVLATIADMSYMVAVVNIDETDVPQVAIGQEAKVVADAMPDSSFAGKVIKVGLMPITSQSLTDQTTEFEVEVELDSFSTLLRPGMNVIAEIVTSQKQGVIAVPIQAVGKRKIKDKTVQSAFVVRGGKAVAIEVTEGIVGEEAIEIISGLSEGDSLITGPYRVLAKLKDGMRVTPLSAEPGGETGDTLKPTRGAVRLFRGAACG